MSNPHENHTLLTLKQEIENLIALHGNMPTNVGYGDTRRVGESIHYIEFRNGSAFDEGYEEGYDAGKAEKDEAEYNKGYETGYDEGYDAGARDKS